MKIDECEVEINIVPSDLCGFFNYNKSKLKNKMVCIASNPQSKVDIYLTEEYAMPSVIVFENDNQIYKEPCSSQKDSEFTLKDIYDQFLFPKKVSVNGKYKDAFEDDEPLTEEDRKICEELTRIDQDDAINERDTDLFLAFEDFMCIVLDEDSYILDDSSYADEIYEMMGEILDIIAAHELPVYRPMYMEDESGEEVFVEYPYARKLKNQNAGNCGK